MKIKILISKNKMNVTGISLFLPDDIILLGFGVIHKGSTAKISTLSEKISADIDENFSAGKFFSTENFVCQNILSAEILNMSN